VKKFQIRLISRLSISCALLLASVQLVGQYKDIQIDNSYNKLLWVEFVNKIESNFPVQFYFDCDSLPNFEVLFAEKELVLPLLLSKILLQHKHKAIFDNSGNIVIINNLELNTSIPDIFFSGSIPDNDIANEESEDKNPYLKTDSTFISNHFIVGKKSNDTKPTAVVSGYIKSGNNDSPIISGNILVKETGLVAHTDTSGFYKLNLTKGTYTLVINSFDTKEETLKIEVLSDGKFDLMLEPKFVALDEVIVSSEREHNVKSTQMGFQKIAIKEIKEIPLVLGESDIIKVSLLLPGIQSVGEGSSGFNVRGSPTDQNLFVINQVPIYNPSHLFGFFSAFNSDAIKSFSHYKSNIPTNFGGRLSSIFDIKTKQGNKNSFTSTGGISPVTARILVEGPLKKEKSSYMIGFRSTYSDWLLKKVKDSDIKNSDAQFMDIITNFSFELNKKNQLDLFSYHSNDQFSLLGQSNYKYSNNGGSLSWSHIFNQRYSLQTSLIFSQYSFTEKNTEIEISSYKESFDLKHSEAKTSLSLKLNEKHTLTSGISTALYLIDKGDFSPLNSYSNWAPLNLGEEKAIETAIFISDEWELSSKLSINAGLRYNGYFYLGPQNVLRFSNDAPKSKESIIDTILYSNNQVVKQYSSPDLRFAARYIIADNLSIKLIFNQLKQYLFMLSNTIAISPTDRWKLCDYHIKPMSGSQFSFGVYKNIYYGKYDLSIETYYKSVDNIVEYKNGANLVVNENPELDILQGKLKSYGVELMVKKSVGKFNGWVNYTYSRAINLVDSHFKEESINNGEAFSSNYDKPNAFNLVANYKFSRRISVSSNVVYSTGRPITYPVGVFYQNEMELLMYSKRNEYRIPDYFRIDFSLKLEGNLASKKFAHSTWILSVYNLTGRKNTYSVFFNSEEGKINAYKLAIFGIPIFSLTYNFKLGNYAN